MDEVEKRLRRDAGRIDAPVTSEVEARVRASLEQEQGRTEVFAARKPRSDPSPPLGLWMAASLSGAAVALLAFLLLPRPEPPARAPAALAQSAPLPESIAREFPLTVKTAELTAPLEQELENLQSDIEKARERVKKDLDF